MTQQPHRARKRFGQHFLTDISVLHQITDAIGLQDSDCVVEIGPGLGALTEHVLTHTPHINAVELDRDLIEQLQHKFSPQQLTLHAGDALKFNFQMLSQKPQDLRIIGNLPYNISTPLIFHLFSQIDCIKDMHFMLQKEVVERLTAPVNDRHYGRLSVMAQYFCEADYLFTVSPNAFSPPPKVNSAVVRLIPLKHRQIISDFRLFETVVKQAFMYRRKQLANCLKKLITAEQLQSLDIEPSRRPQSLTVDEFVRIAEAISLQ